MLLNPSIANSIFGKTKIERFCTKSTHQGATILSKIEKNRRGIETDFFSANVIRNVID